MHVDSGARFEQRRQDAHLSKSKQDMFKDMKQEESHENEQHLGASGGMRGARGNTCDGPSSNETAPPTGAPAQVDTSGPGGS